MKRFLKSPEGITLISSVILALIAIGAWLFPFHWKDKSLEVSLTNNTELTPTSDISKDNDLAFVYKGETVQNLISTKFRFKNTGAQPIEAADFVQDFSITFPSDTRIIDFKVNQVQPIRAFSAFQQTFAQKSSDTALNFKPVLINPGEIFDLDVVTTRNIHWTDLKYQPDQIQFDYVIKGISSIDIATSIDTNLNKQTEARQSISDLFYKFILPFGLGGAILFILGLIVPEILKYLPKKEKTSTAEIDIESKKARSRLYSFLMAAFFILLMAYGVFTLVFNAYFLKV